MSIPTDARSIPALRRVAEHCRACDLWKPATQTVFGEGAARAAYFFIGEQAGDKEDLEGRPFVGPAGRLLDDALADVGIDRRDAYVTNVVKHFKFEMRGKRRLHKRANAVEVTACRGWLDRELALVRPRYVICLGSLAARTILGRGIRLMQVRGEWVELGPRRWALPTVHPAYVLRARAGSGGADVAKAFRADLAKLLRPPGS